MESINIYLLISVQTDYPTNSECCPSIKTTKVGCTAVSAGWRRTSGGPLLHSGLIARDGLCRVDTSTVAVHALEIRVAQRSKGRYPPGGVEGKELLEKREGKAPLVKIMVRLENIITNLDPSSTIKRARPCSSMSGTKFSIGLGGRGVKALCGRATSWGQSSAEGTPTTLQG